MHRMTTLHRYRALIALLATPGLLSLSPLGAAQMEDDPQDTGKNRSPIEEVIVTAQKREQALIDVPMSVTAISGQALEEMGAASLLDISQVSPGFSVVEAGPGLQNLQMRGISSTFGKATVGYQFDSVSLTSFSLTQPDAATFDLAGVEVLRGPQGTLYGEGSMGGTIKLISNAPKLDTWEGRLQLQARETRDGDPGHDIDGVLNIPVSERSALRIVASAGETGGFIDQPALDNENANYAKQRNGRIRYQWQALDWLTLDAMVMGAETDGGASNAADENYQQPDRVESRIDDEMMLYSLDLGFDFDFADISFNNAFFDRDFLFNYDGREGVPGLLKTGLAPLDELARPIILEAVNSVPSTLLTQTKTLVSELRISSMGAGRFYWIAGLYYRDFRENSGQSGFINNRGVEVPLQNYIFESESDAKAVFGQIEMDWTPWLNTALGARFFKEQIVTQTRGSSGGMSIDNFDDDTYTAFTPRLTISFRAPDGWDGVAEHIMGYISAAEGFRSGGANIRFSDDSPVPPFGDTVPPTYDPDYITTYEIGGKIIFEGGLVTAEAAIFHNEWEEVQQATRGDTFSWIANVGNTEGTGVELNLMWSPLPGLNINLSGAYIDTEFTSGSLSKEPGDPVDFVAPKTASAGVSYSFNWIEGYPGFARIDYNYSDKTVYFDRGLNYDFESDVIRFVNARIGLEREAYQVYLFGRNLLDQRIAVDANRIEFQARSRPRTLGLELNINF